LRASACGFESHPPHYERIALIDAREEIEALVGFEGRGPGTDAERRAAMHVSARLEHLGRAGATEQVTIDDEALERAYAFCGELTERLDTTVGPDLDRPVEATLLKEEA
jgi:hypothetical protein